MRPVIINKLFPLQLWLTSVVLIGPLLVLIGGVIEDHINLKSPETLSSITLIIVFGLLYSIPMFTVSIFWFSFLINQKMSQLQIKILFVLICILGVFITFSILARDSMMGFKYYPLSIIISSFFYRRYKYAKT